ncbi:MAG TPA: hypothetical protein VE130_02560 [Nitrososphaeraceae archaeon]|nr:hypothetical protein [Nitrososphaeraceae archaeon]
MMSKKATAVGILSTLFTLSAVLATAPYSNTVLAQGEGPPGEAGVTTEPESAFPLENQSLPLAENQTETVTEFENIAGSDQGVIGNDTTISNINNTEESDIGVNLREDCMTLPSGEIVNPEGQPCL